jgi:hypothetical protein
MDLTSYLTRRHERKRERGTVNLTTPGEPAEIIAQRIFP